MHKSDWPRSMLAKLFKIFSLKIRDDNYNRELKELKKNKNWTSSAELLDESNRMRNEAPIRKPGTQKPSSQTKDMIIRKFWGKTPCHGSILHATYIMVLYLLVTIASGLNKLQFPQRVSSSQFPENTYTIAVYYTYRCEGDWRACVCIRKRSLFKAAGGKF